MKASSKGGSDRNKAGVDGLGKVANVSKAGKTGDNSDFMDGEDSGSDNDEAESILEMGERFHSCSSTLFHSNSTSHQCFTAFLVRSAGGEVIGGGEGAGGGVWEENGGTGCDGGGWQSGWVLGSAWAPSTVLVRLHQHRRWQWCLPTGPREATSGMMGQQKIVTSWLPAWGKIVIRALSLVATHYS
jgi:hypothetical protein